MPAEPYRTTFELEKALEGRWPYNDSIRERLIATARRALELESELAATKAELVAAQRRLEGRQRECLEFKENWAEALRERDEARIYAAERVKDVASLESKVRFLESAPKESR